MALKFFNTLSRSVQEFVPLQPEERKVRMYCCGPTVHDHAHIGNFRTFIFTDLVRRYLEFKGYSVEHVMNITDVEDKIIKRIRSAHVSLRDHTRKYEAAFLEDLQTLNCLLPHRMPRATEHIEEIISLIGKLMARGLAYQAVDGSVYFSIEKYRSGGGQYGQLVKLNFDQMRAGDRVKNDEYAKESIADFALWKARTPEDGDVFWPSPWGEGRPGWHIECSAMSMKLLGPSFDLHIGGEDLIFPHHEDEIAQSEGAALQAPGQRFVKYWLHGAHLLVEGKKMSKSLGNFYTLRDLLQKGFTGREVRYLLLTAHYRDPFNFTLEGLLAARSALARLDECLSKLQEISAGPPDPSQESILNQFSEALDENLNISAGWGAIFNWVRDLNRAMAENSVSPAQAAGAIAAWQRLDAALGLGMPRSLPLQAFPGGAERGTVSTTQPENEIPSEIAQLLTDRQAARAAKDFRRADLIRDQLKTKGWVIEDTPKGPRLKRG
jgi:cysteinyl-tRNA synthetase